MLIHRHVESNLERVFSRLYDDTNFSLIFPKLEGWDYFFEMVGWIAGLPAGFSFKSYKTSLKSISAEHEALLIVLIKIMDRPIAQTLVDRLHSSAFPAGQVSG